MGPAGAALSAARHNHSQSTPTGVPRTAAATPSPSSTPAPTAGLDPRLIQEAGAAYEAGEAALRDGDWTGYDRERKRLGQILERLRQPAPTPAAEPAR